jgi:hypothetical protein
MNNQQKEAIGDIIGEFIAIKYELSLYVDDGLLRLGESLENAIDKLNQVLGTLESEPLPTETEAELADPDGHNPAPTNSSAENERSTGSLDQQDDYEAPLVTTILPHRAAPRASGILKTMRRDAAPEIIDLSRLNLQNLEAFFPSERATAKAKGEGKEKL